MRFIVILSALQGAALAERDSTRTKTHCETRMSRTEALFTNQFTIRTELKVTKSIPYSPVTTTIVTRSIYTSLITAPEKIKILTITMTSTETDLTTPTFMITDTTVTTRTSTLTSTVTVPTISGFTPLALASGVASQKRSLSKRTLIRRKASEGIEHTFPPRVFPRKAKPTELEGPCIMKIGTADKKHPVEPARYRGALACYTTLQIIQTEFPESCIAWTRTMTLESKTAIEHKTARGYITRTVTEAETTLTADETTTTTMTITKATTTKTTTKKETVTLTFFDPAESSWAACNADNLVNSANGGHGIDAVNLGTNSYNILPLTTAYECCVECQKRENCIFSVAYHGACYHVIGTACLPEHSFGTNFTTFGKLLPKDGPTLSNGPCGHVKNAGDSGSAV
ncbi:hypothetical protein FGADI_3388 [Fusarium gaditjirri]|uniref:Apple domain-containing protein n=1 Tax=Fusarium gaditjirri TaxID=282569 RepID=A0A8H4TFI1_9HYPO|nr:hypothetical protein FGADI_3388 [Fusarium gaditjirri]